MLHCTTKIHIFVIPFVCFFPSSRQSPTYSQRSTKNRSETQRYFITNKCPFFSSSFNSKHISCHHLLLKMSMVLDHFEYVRVFQHQLNQLKNPNLIYTNVH